MSTADYISAEQQTAQAYGIDPNVFVSLANAESSQNANAVSSAGAQGLYQLMPATGQSLGVSNPFDANQNMTGAAQYLSHLLSRAGGDYNTAIEWYNCGPGNTCPAGIAEAGKVMGLANQMPSFSVAHSGSSPPLQSQPWSVQGTDLTAMQSGTTQWSAGVQPSGYSSWFSLPQNSTIQMNPTTQNLQNVPADNTIISQTQNGKVPQALATSQSQNGIAQWLGKSFGDIGLILMGSIMILFVLFDSGVMNHPAVVKTLG